MSLVEGGLTSRALPVGGEGRVSTAWWAMACLIATEAILFVYLIFSFAYLGTQTSGPWPPAGKPSLWLALPNSGLLLLSSISAWRAGRARRGGRTPTFTLLWVVTIVLGTAFVVIQGFEWAAKPFGLSTSAYGSAYFTLTGFHIAHVIAGLVMLIAVLVWSLARRLRPYHGHVELVSIYWHFVDAVWLCVFVTIYVVPWL